VLILLLRGSVEITQRKEKRVRWRTVKSIGGVRKLDRRSTNPTANWRRKKLTKKTHIGSYRKDAAFFLAKGLQKKKG